MKKIIFLVIMLFFITGCSVNYNVSINKDETITESISIYGTENLYKTYYKTSKIDVLKENLDNYIDSLEEFNYNYELIENENPYVLISKKYDNIEDYLKNSKFFNDYFDEISYNKSGSVVKIETIGFNPNEQDNLDRFYVENLNIDISSKYIITNTLGDYKEDDNKVIYKMDKDTSDFKIMLEYDLSKTFNPYRIQYIMIIIAVIVIIINWVVFYFVNKKKKI